MNTLRSLLITLALLSQTSCGVFATPEPDTPTPLPSPRLEDLETAIAGTATGEYATRAALNSATPPAPATEPAPNTETPSAPTPIPPSPTLLPSPTEPAIGEDLNEEAILILEPGFLSRVTSPVRVAGMADPTFEQNLVVQVFDENGAVLAQTPTTIGADVGQRGPFAVDVAFAVAAEQPGRIVVFSDSPRDGGLVHLASVEVTLLASGAAVINPPDDHPEDIIIYSPRPGETVSGGMARVTGYSVPTFEQTLVIEVHGEDGAVLGSGPTIIAAELGFGGEFEADIPYSVLAAQPGRIVVFHESARDGGLLHLSSVEVTLAP